MPPLEHRDPGPILAFLDDPRVTVELIFDGIHVSPELAAFVMRIIPDRIVLVTDAMAAAGAPDGDYMLGELPVEVRDRVARLAGKATIAGSTLTLDRAVRNAVAGGIPLAQAVRSATSHPADYLNLSGVGRIAVGNKADMVTLDDDAVVTGVMYRGAWQ
jgi:N-acetylglucosamine-6-phosphate deacetylase